MNTRAENEASPIDTIKIAAAVIVLLGAIGAYYYYADMSKLLRVVGLVIAAGVAIAIMLQTAQGRAISAFVHDSHVEVRKVVWPTRQETFQTTGVIIIVVLIAAIMLWLFDSLLGVVMRAIIG